jgi:lipopolysaccharide transport system ATP-binding protein
VAAHLDPQIMIVDEVLAVGDAAFQNKCLGKMDDVVKEGRTVLFVSHQMNAVAGLCNSVMIVKDGQVGPRLPTEEGIAEYLGAGGQQAGLSLADRPRTQDRKRDPIFHHLRITGDDGEQTNVIPTGGGVSFEIGLKDFDEPGLFTCGVALRNRRGQRVAFFHSEYHSGLTMAGAASKMLRCEVPHLPLGTGTYAVELVISDGFKILERVERAADLEIIFSDLLGTGKLPTDLQSSVILPANWQEVAEQATAPEASGLESLHRSQRSRR